MVKLSSLLNYPFRVSELTNIVSWGLQTAHLDFVFPYRNMRVILSIYAFFSLFVVQTYAAVASSEEHPHRSHSEMHKHHSDASFSGYREWHHTKSYTGSPAAVTPTY